MAVEMPKIVATGNEAAFYFQPNASHWKIKGLEITNEGKIQYNALVQGGFPISYLTFEENWIHPAEEDGTMNNITYRSCENAFIINGDHFTWRYNAIQGFTGWTKCPRAAVCWAIFRAIRTARSTSSSIAAM